MPEDLHSEEGSKTAKTGGEKKERLFGDPPFALFCLGFVSSVKDEGNKVHYYVKHKKNLHAYIIIDVMSFSKALTGLFFKMGVFALCLTVPVFAPSCSILDEIDDPEGEITYDESYKAATESSQAESSGLVPSSTDVEMGYDKVSKAYTFNAWYDVEKDNPATYNTIDTEDAYALKCVFYFSEPVSATFRVILKNGDEQVAVKTIRIDEKVIAECDFSAGLEDMDSFKPGIYTMHLEYEGKSVAVSGEMRIE